MILPDIKPNVTMRTERFGANDDANKPVTARATPHMPTVMRVNLWMTRHHSKPVNKQ